MLRKLIRVFVLGLSVDLGTLKPSDPPSRPETAMPHVELKCMQRLADLEVWKGLVRDLCHW